MSIAVPAMRALPDGGGSIRSEHLASIYKLIATHFQALPSLLSLLPTAGWNPPGMRNESRSLGFLGHVVSGIVTILVNVTICGRREQGMALRRQRLGDLLGDRLLFPIACSIQISPSRLVPVAATIGHLRLPGRLCPVCISWKFIIIAYISFLHGSTSHQERVISIQDAARSLFLFLGRL